MLKFSTATGSCMFSTMRSSYNIIVYHRLWKKSRGFVEKTTFICGKYFGQKKQEETSLLERKEKISTAAEAAVPSSFHTLSPIASWKSRQRTNTNSQSPSCLQKGILPNLPQGCWLWKTGLCIPKMIFHRFCVGILWNLRLGFEISRFSKKSLTDSSL